MPPAVYGRSVAAWALADLGDFAEGRCLAAEALAIATTLDHPHSIIFASIGAGTVELRRGEAADALAVLERAHAVWRTADLPAVLIELAGPLASAYAAMGRAGEAIALLEEAVAQAIALRHGFGHVLRTGGLAEAYLAAGRVEDALPLAQLYVEVARMVHLRGTEAWALRLLADVEIHREKPGCRGRDAGARRRPRHRGRARDAPAGRAVSADPGRARPGTRQARGRVPRRDHGARAVPDARHAAIRRSGRGDAPASLTHGRFVGRLSRQDGQHRLEVLGSGVRRAAT